MSPDKNAGRSHNIKAEHTSFKSVEEVWYLGKTLTNQNSIQEEIKSRLNWIQGMLAILQCTVFWISVC